MQMSFISLFVALILLTGIDKSNAQCCGTEYLISMMVQSGINGGYGVQYYNPEGFNNYINLYNQKYAATIKTKMGEFGAATGFKIGANLIQLKLDEFLVAFKVDYHQLNEKKSAMRDLTLGGNAEEEFDLTLSSIGLGIASSLIVSKRFEIKFFDAMINWNSAKLVYHYSDPFATTEQTLKDLASKVGFNIGGGFTFYPLPRYISIEATGGYSFLSISQMQYDNGYLLPEIPEENAPAMKNFVKSGGLFVFIQLNLVIPLK